MVFPCAYKVHFIRTPHSDIRNLIESVDSIQLHNELLSKYQCLEVALNQASLFIPSYDLFSYNKIMKAIQFDVEAKKNLVMPRSKFKFSRRVGNGGEKVVVDSAKALSKLSSAHPPPPSPAPPPITPNSLKLSDLTNECVSVVEVKSVCISNCTDCEFTISPSTPSVQLFNCKRCKLHASPIHGPLMIYNCSALTIEAACDQVNLSLHQSHQSFDVTSQRMFILTSTFPRIPSSSRVHPQSFLLHSTSITMFILRLVFGSNSFVAEPVVEPLRECL